jgi:hypothetical protein
MKKTDYGRIITATARQVPDLSRFDDPHHIQHSQIESRRTDDWDSISFEEVQVGVNDNDQF